MNADRRIVPAHHVTSVLAEDGISKRANEVRDTLQKSPNKLNQVAQKWTSHDGMNPLSRVFLQHAGKIPRKTQHLSPLPVATMIRHEIPQMHGEIHASTSESARKDHHHEQKDDHKHSKYERYEHDNHSKSHRDHGHDTHTHHAHDNHHTHSASVVKEENHKDSHHHHPKIAVHEHHEHEHDHDHGHGHSHGHGHDHGHDAHGHGGHGHHDEEHGHGGHFASFISTGHWFGDQGAFIFGLIGRLIGEIVGYILKLIGVMMFFGPTRTMILVVLGCILLNTLVDTTLPIWVSGAAFGIIHMILAGIQRISGGGGEHGGAESHGGGHGESHGHH